MASQTRTSSCGQIAEMTFWSRVTSADQIVLTTLWSCVTSSNLEFLDIKVEMNVVLSTRLATVYQYISYHIISVRLNHSPGAIPLAVSILQDFMMHRGKATVVGYVQYCTICTTCQLMSPLGEGTSFRYL